MVFHLKKIVRKTEFYIFITLVVLALVIQLRSGQFFTGNNLVDLVRSMIIPAMFAIGAQMVIISGGIDVSFTAIASLAMFATTKLLLNINFGGSIWVPYLMGAGLGLMMGLLNALLIAHFKFNTMIVTLGTSSIFIGIMQGVLGARELPVPEVMKVHGKAKLFTAHNAQSGLNSDMPVTFLILIVLLILAFFIMKYTMLGRGIYAIGGDEVSAKRAGFNVLGIQIFLYCFVGLMAGVTGIARASMMLNCHPTNLNGMEMTVIAAVVLGGTRVNGGAGSLTGAMLGVALMTIMSNSLILLGIPTYWQKVFIGAIILIGTGVSGYKTLKAKNSLISTNNEA